MLDLKDFMPINFLKKERYTGSCQGMRFCMEKLDSEGGEPRLLVTVWPEPYSYDATPEAVKQKTVLEFSSSGIAEGVDWINGQFVSQMARWKSVSRR